MLESGQLLPDDPAIREGESEWKPLRELFPPQTLKTTAPPGKSGCRRVLGMLMIVVGILGLVGGIAGFAVSLSLGEPPICKLADQRQAEAKEALQKYESNPTVENTENIKIVQNGAADASRACGEALDYYGWVRIALIGAAVLGLISAIVGYFLRR